MKRSHDNNSQWPPSFPSSLSHVTETRHNRLNDNNLLSVEQIYSIPTTKCRLQNIIQSFEAEEREKISNKHKNKQVEWKQSSSPYFFLFNFRLSCYTSALMFLFSPFRNDGKAVGKDLHVDISHASNKHFIFVLSTLLRKTRSLKVNERNFP